MVSAVHLVLAARPKVLLIGTASKGLHMVSAVHPLPEVKFIASSLSFKGAAHG